MTLNKAIVILNRERHRRLNYWEYRIKGLLEPLNDTSGHGKHNEWLTPFEAIAVAEKYERQKSDLYTGDNDVNPSH